MDSKRVFFSDNCNKKNRLKINFETAIYFKSVINTASILILCGSF